MLERDGPIRVLSVLGTRPEAIKMAPVVLEMRRRPTFDPIVCLTAQHRELLDEPLKLFGVDADHDLDLMRQTQDPVDLTSRALPGLTRVIRETKPDVILVQGDTTTAFCGAFAGFHERVRVGHVEAGLRTGRRYEPFPEEMNRLLVGRLADDHFAPTPAARQALLGEGVPEPSIYVTGNTVVDAVQHVASLPEDRALEIAPGEGRRLVLVTCHRREHHGEIQRGIFRAIRSVVEQVPDVEVVFPVHPHPEVLAAAAKVLGGVPRVHLVDPLSYGEFVALLKRATLVVTDSGGVQEEAPSLQVPAVVLRRATERAEGLEAGTAILAGSDSDTIRDLVLDLLGDPERLQSMRAVENPYGDGQASVRICNALEAELLDSDRLSALESET